MAHLPIVTDQQANQWVMASEDQRAEMLHAMVHFHGCTAQDARRVYRLAVNRIYRGLTPALVQRARTWRDLPQPSRVALLMFRTGDAMQRQDVLSAYARSHNTDYSDALKRFVEAARIARKLDGDQPLAIQAHVAAHPEVSDPAREAAARAAVDKLGV